MYATKIRLNRSYTLCFTLINVLLILNLGEEKSALCAQEIEKKSENWQSKGNVSINDKQISNGWISLFDGYSLYGWRVESKANWTVSKGAIVVDSGARGLLRTSTQFDDYLLQLEFRSEASTNSGVFLRTSPSGSDPKKNCYELNIADTGTNPFPTGSLVGRKKAEFKADSREWQKFEVEMRGSKVKVKIDGKAICSYNDPSPLGKGYIGLQHNSGKVEFKNIFLKPLGTKSIFNGKDLNGWKKYPKMKSEFSVTKDNLLNVKDGRGQLETKDSYGDFVFQMAFRTNKASLNSGIFFRCIPGETMNGYESQIHNGFKENDRSKPVDCGTGGIFRRQNARYVAGNDNEWTYKTIFVEGPHITTWVNGIQVADWTDKRKPNANPRRGYRKTAGTIMIQGHDPTTDVDFKDLKIRELSRRNPKK